MESDWRAIQARFEASLGLPSQERQTLMATLIQEFPEFESRVKALFANIEHSFYENPTLIESGHTPQTGSDLSIGGFIGSYQIKAELGHGGMGVVYLAEQFVPIHREVAIKVIRSESASSRATRLFEQERQALALMNHPAIASIFEAGETASGNPYFAMEYVSGLPIHHFCTQHKLDLEARIRLFIETAEGLRHAHQKGMIHRDIKPGNILVKRLDGRNLPKIIDFGLARLFDSEAGGLLGTHAGMQGTPAYMSPEQIAGEGIDTRSDVFALTLVLYQLLIGSLPYERECSGVSEVIRRILLLQDKPFITASKRFQDLQESANFAAEMGISPAKLLRILKKDLDWVLAKGLSAQPEQRYDSVGALIEDLNHFLKGEPVNARPKSPLYSWRKWVARHKLLVSAASAVLLALILGGTLAAVGWQRATLARKRADLGFQRATLANQKAEREAAKAQAINKFLVEMFDAAQPELMGRDVKVSQVLDHAAEKLQAEFRDQDEVKVSLMVSIGKTYLGLGEVDKGTAILASATKYGEEKLGKYHIEAITALSSWSNAIARNSDMENINRAIEMNKKVLQNLEQSGQKQTQVYTETLHDLALNLYNNGNRLKSIPYFQGNYSGHFSDLVVTGPKEYCLADSGYKLRSMTPVANEPGMIAYLNPT